MFSPMHLSECDRFLIRVAREYEKGTIPLPEVNRREEIKRLFATHNYFGHGNPRSSQVVSDDAVVVAIVRNQW
jgi:hypothetical protein